MTSKIVKGRLFCLGITTVLTLSTFGLDTKTDLPKVSYPTALDWFVIMCFMFVISTLLEFAGVHYFTKIGSGEYPCVESGTESDDGFASSRTLGLSTVSGRDGVRTGFRQLLKKIDNTSLKDLIKNQCETRFSHLVKIFFLCIVWFVSRINVCYQFVFFALNIYLVLVITSNNFIICN